MPAREGVALYKRTLIHTDRVFCCVSDMQLIDNHKEQPPNITGLSLVLFLFLSMLSMMAAYEVSRPSDDIRSSVIVSFHEYAGPSADTESHKPALFFRAVNTAAPNFERMDAPARPSTSFIPAPRLAFNARGPPAEIAAS